MPKMVIKLMLFCLAATCFQSIALAGDLSGTFKFEKKPPYAGLVYFSEDNSLGKDDGPVVDQKDQQFVPMLTVGAQGSNILFTNSDELEHNVFAEDPDAGVSFDTGLAPPGNKTEQALLWESGQVVRIGCKIHPKMRGYVASITSKYHHAITFDRSDDQFEFSLKGVPATLTKVAVWLPNYDPIEVNIKVGESVEVPLTKSGNSRGVLVLKR